jgi:hypothetical protein
LVTTTQKHVVKTITRHVTAATHITPSLTTLDMAIIGGAHAVIAINNRVTVATRLVPSFATATGAPVMTTISKHVATATTVRACAVTTMTKHVVMA